MRAALLHRAGRRDLLLFNMREAFDEGALKLLGYESIDEILEPPLDDPGLLERRRSRTR